MTGPDGAPGKVIPHFGRAFASFPRRTFLYWGLPTRSLGLAFHARFRRSHPLVAVLFVRLLRAREPGVAVYESLAARRHGHFDLPTIHANITSNQGSYHETSGRERKKVNRHLSKRLQSIRDALVTQHSNVEALPDARSGWQSKLFLAEFLGKVFPGPHRFSTGSIMDSAGNLAAGVDIAVEHPAAPSFPMSGPSQDRLLMAESVAMVIEVRSDLSSELASIGSTVRRIRALRRRADPLAASGHRFPETIPVVAVGYAGYSDLQRLQRRLDSVSREFRPNGALVIEPGLFEGFGIKARGAVALYGLCMAINRALHQLNAVVPDLSAYVRSGGVAGSGNAEKPRFARGGRL